jgi:hypothetical protein
VNQEFRDLISKIKCGEITPATFSEDDLAKVKACLPPAQAPKSATPPAEPAFKESCLPAALKAAQDIIESEQSNIKKATEVSKVRSRLVEYQDNLRIVDEYFTERLNFFLSVSQSTDLINAERLSIVSKINAERKKSKPNNDTIKSLRDAEIKLRNQAREAVSQKIDSILIIGVGNVATSLFTTALNTELKKISGKISANYPDKSTVFTFKFFELDSGEVQDGQTKYSIPIRKSQFFKNAEILSNLTTNVTLASEVEDRNKKNEANCFLYEGRDNYGGLYRRLRSPIQNLFTLDERGLTTKVDEVDPVLKENPDAPKTIKEDDLTYYIKDLAKYESFYDNIKTELPDRTENEKKVTYPAQIASIVTKIKGLARREAATQIVQFNLEENISQSTTYNSVTYSPTSTPLSNALKIYRAAVTSVQTKISELDTEIANLDTLIKEYSVDPDKVSAKIAAIPCFKTKQVQNNCEAEALKKKGIDPFGLKTLNGTNAGLPDPTTFCYWKYFAEEMTKFGILPIPDIKAPLFRYYPVNGVIPAFPGPIILTLPQKFKVISVISSPLGIIVPMISVPITFPSPIPIPIPSIFVLYIAPDSNKYMILAPHLPFLAQPGQMSLGFEVDSSPASQNPIGLSGPYAGLPIKGAFSIPLKLSAGASKSVRLAKIAIDVAQGKPIQVNLPNGLPAPGDPGELNVTDLINKLKSENEFALDAVETTPLQDFDRLVYNIRNTITTQLDSLGDIATEKMQKIKDKTREAKESALERAKLEPNSERRRKLKTASRSIDPAFLEDKIDALIGEANSIIDSINLGSITYPDDPSKLNPKLPAALTSITELLALASTGKFSIPSDTNLVTKIKRISKKLDAKQFTDQAEYDLEKDEDVSKLKTALTRMSKSCVDYLKGKKQQTNTDEARSDKEAEDMSKGADEFQDLLVKSLSFTAVSLASPPKISVFDPTKPCCEIPAESLFKGVPPEVLAVLSVFSSLSAALIQNLSKDDLTNLFGGVKQVSADLVQSAFDSLISMIPDIPIPKSFDPVAMVSSLIVPILSAISLPEAPDPARPILPIQIKIPLDAILKPLLKLALAALIRAILRMLADLFNKKDGAGANSGLTADDVIREIDCGSIGIVTLKKIKENQIEITLPNGKKVKLPTFPDLPLDILKYFALLASTDIISLFKKLILSALDSILDPISAIVRPILSLVPSGSWESLSVLDLANPLTAIIKTIKKKIKDALGKGLKVNLLNLEIYPILLAVALPILENLEKYLKEIAYLGTAVLCATGGAGVQIARLAHPIFNQDDLPPWERLTRKNPLFAIFLDEFLHKSTIMSLGTLIFSTKLPGMYGVTTVPNLFVPPPRL